MRFSRHFGVNSDYSDDIFLGRTRSWKPVETKWVTDFDSVIDVTCWCERRVVKLSVRDWHKYGTRTCGEADCSAKLLH